MSNPFQQGPSGFLPDPTSSAGLPGSGRRRPSYASAATTNPSGRPFRAGAVANLLNPSPDGADAPSTAYTGAWNYSFDTASHGASSGGLRGSGRPSRPTYLPWYSRAFDEYSPTLNESATGFLAPSYLKGSVYLRKLEEAHRAKILAQRGGQSTQPHAPGDSVMPAGGSSLSLHAGKLGAPPPPPPSHRGMTFDVVEKPPAFEEDEAVSPLPSRWDKDAKNNALEVLGDGYEVKCVGARTTDRDHEAYAIRADNPMPAQCGVYYFEVLILNRKREE